MDNTQTEKIVEVNYQPYTKKKYFFSMAELKFYHILKDVIGEKYLIFPKVRISDLIQAKYTKNKYTWFNKIRSKHADFVICTKDPITPKVIIELDDNSHTSLSRKERDNFINEAFANAGIPTIHIKVKSEYNKEELIEQIKEAYNTKYSIRKNNTQKEYTFNNKIELIKIFMVIILTGALFFAAVLLYAWFSSSPSLG